MDVWIALTFEGNTDLIKLLNRVERKEEGYGTVIIPQAGFSSDDDVHNAVLQWLKGKGVNVYSPHNEQASLEYALHGRIYYE